MPTPGSTDDRIGPYQVEKELARGGMGVVYVARHVKLDRRVALKVQLAHAADSDEADRFQIEAQAAARLNHPHIVAIHDVGEDQGRPYLAMDLVEGTSLKDKIEDEGPLEPDEAARIIEEMAEALNYAHTRAILHRDIKPHNILLDQEGKALLTDFGLAKQVDGEESGLTQTGQIMGTPAYMPPEQADGDFERVDRRADVYALGATLYQALTGKPPFEGSTAMQIVFKVLNEEVVSPQKVRPELHVDLVTICLKCLEKEPEERYSTAKELAQELARYRRGQAIQARPVGLFGKLARRARRNQRATGALALVGLVVIVLSTGGALYANHLRGEAQAATDEARRKEAKAVAAEKEAVAQKERAERAQAEADAEREKADAEASRARAQSQLFEGINQLSLDRPEGALGSFVAARAEIGELDPRLARAAEYCARQAIREGRFDRVVAQAPPRERIKCDVTSQGRGALAVLTGPKVRVFDQDDLDRPRFESAMPTDALAPRLCRFVPEAGLLVVGHAGQRQLFLRAHDWPGGRERWIKSANDFTLAADILIPTPAGLVLSVQQESRVEAWLLDPRTGETLAALDSARRPNSRPAAVESAAVLPGNGKALLLGYDDGTIHVWDLQTRQPAQAIHLHTDQVRGAVVEMAFLPPGHFGAPPNLNTLLSGTGGGKVKRTTFAQGHEPETLIHYQKGPLRSLEYVLEPTPLLALAFGDGQVMVFDDDFEQIASFGALRGNVDDVGFSKDGRYVFVAQAGRVGRWVLPSRRTYPAPKKTTIVTRTERPLVALSSRDELAYVGVDANDEEWIFVIGSDGGVRHKLPIGVPADHTRDGGSPNGSPNPRPAVRSLAFDPSGRTLAAGIRPWRSMFQGSPDVGRVELWPLGRPNDVRRIPLDHPIGNDRLGRPLEEVGYLRFSPDGHQLFQGFFNRDDAQRGRVMLRNSETYEVEAQLVWHLSVITGAAWTQDALVTCSLDGSAASWPLTGALRAPTRVFAPHARDLRHPEGVATTFPYVSIVPNLGTPPQSTRQGFQDTLHVNVHGAAGRDGPGLSAIDARRCTWRGEEREVVLVGTGQGELFLWDRETGETLAQWEAHREGAVLACRLLEDGLVLSVGQEAKLWIQLGERFQQLAQQRLGPSGATVQAVDVVGAKVVALTSRRGQRELVTVDLSLAPLPGFHDDPRKAVQPYRAW